MEDEILDDGPLVEPKRLYSPEESLRINRLVTEANDVMKKAKQGRNGLWFIVGYLVFTGFIIFISTDDHEAVLNSVVGLLIFIIPFTACALLFRIKPQVFLIIGLIIYTIIVVLEVTADPSSIVKGILIKIIVFYFLIRGITAFNQFKSLKGKLKKLDYPLSYLDNIDKLVELPKVDAIKSV